MLQPARENGRCQEISGQEISGQEISGQEISGQEISGQEISGQETRGEETGREEVGRRPNQEDYRDQILNFPTKHYLFFTVVIFKYNVRPISRYQSMR